MCCEYSHTIIFITVLIFQIENSRGGQAVKSSTTFFSQLQDEVTSQVKQKSQGANKRKKDSKSLSAKRLKL